MDEERKVMVCAGTGCLSSGAEEIEKEFRRVLKKKGLTQEYPVSKIVKKTGCMGPCSLGPVVVIMPEETFYGNLEPEDVPKIVDQHIEDGEIVEELLLEDDEGHKIEEYSEIDYIKNQKRVVMQNMGKIDPHNIQDYVEEDGYRSLEEVVKEFSSEEVIEEIKESGLRGRGGAGFPTGKKWEFTAAADGDQKYVVCNADEGDPGAFMDRSILEGDPHRVIEAMAITGYAIGADQGYVYVRAEYPLAVKTLRKAISDAEKHNYLGENLFGTDFDFNLDIRVGAGAFVCGEETALLASIEGKRGQPSPKPPYPANKGLWNKPTVINNVETLANIPTIIRKGADWFDQIGTEKSSGTKVFAVAGDVNNTGLVEVPMGTTLEEIIDIAGGVDGEKFKAAQIGGPSGGTLPQKFLDLNIDYESLEEAGAMVGSGGLVVMNQDNCMVDIARFFLDFVQEESCGKCPPCRDGTQKMLEILERITQGEGEPEDLERLENLAVNIKKAALCGLGQTAPNPVTSTLEHFRDEYEAHVVDKECPTGQCHEMVEAYVIDPDTCVGCTQCVPVCPVDAISGETGKSHKIDADKCIACGECADICPVNAISQGGN